jgi:exodeoxyribonuclease-1
MSVIRAALPEELTDIGKDLTDARLQQLLPLYKARNFPKSLSDEERAVWDAHCYAAIMEGGTESRLARYMHRLQQLSQTVTNADKRYLLEELQLYAESIMPAPD